MVAFILVSARGRTFSRRQLERFHQVYFIANLLGADHSFRRTTAVDQCLLRRFEIGGEFALCIRVISELLVGNHLSSFAGGHAGTQRVSAVAADNRMYINLWSVEPLTSH